MKLLIVADDLASRTLLTAVVRKWGYDPIAVEGDEAAWLVLQKDEPPRLLLIDAEMPKRNALDLCKRIRKQKSNDSPYIILSGDSNNITVAGLENVANDYISKPFEHTALQARLQVGRRMLELQARVRDSESKLRTVIDQSPVSVALYDLTGLQTQVNRAWEIMWDATSEDSIGKFNILTDPQMKKSPIYPQIVKAFNGHKQSIDEWYFDPEISGFEGRVRYMHSHIYPLKNEKGEIQNIVLSHEDITERKQTENALRNSEQRWKFALEGAGDGVWDYNFLTEKNIGSIQMKKILGFNMDLLDANDCHYLDDWKERLHPDSQAKTMKVFQDVLDNKTDAYVVEQQVRCEDGSYKWLLIRGKVVNRSEDGRPLRMIGTASDLSKRKQDEAAIYKLAQVVEQTGESILITDKSGIIEYVNTAFTKQTGYSADDVLGKKPTILKSGQQSTSFYKTMWHTILSGNTWQGKLIGKKKDGSLYPLMMTISPIKNQAGEITHFVGLQLDISKNEELEQKFYQAQKMEALGTLVGGIAHEFNNALAGITGNLYLTRSKVSNMPDVVERLDTIEKLAYHSADLIKSMLAFARKGNIEKTTFDLAAFLKEAIKIHRLSLSEEISLKLDIEATEMLVNWDTNLLQQVVLNLINNARDALKDSKDPSITIRLRNFSPNATFLERHSDVESGRFSCLSISDNGIGINAESLPHIFDPFYTGKDIGQGTGLGLSMIMGSVQSHQGCIEVESTEAKGTTFNIYIPQVHKEETALPAQSEITLAHGAGEIILLADDDPNLLEIGKDVLESLGYRVLTAEDGLQAVDVFKAHKDDIALLITDIMMPRLGGAEAIKRIREIRPDVKVIFVTGYSKDKKRIGDLDPNAMIIHKPYSIEDLSRIIKDQLDHV